MLPRIRVRRALGERALIRGVADAQLCRAIQRAEAGGRRVVAYPREVDGLLLEGAERRQALYKDNDFSMVLHYP